jgi:hypothetical protein
MTPRTYAPTQNTVWAVRVEEVTAWELSKWVSSVGGDCTRSKYGVNVITPHQRMFAVWGEWLVRRVDGTFLVLSEQDFIAAYRET